MRKTTSMMVALVAAICAMGLCRSAAMESPKEPFPPVTIPPRPTDARSGHEVVGSLSELPWKEREQHVFEEIVAGNLPEFLRDFVEISIAATIDDEPHRASYWVMRDYLAIGSDHDFVRMPMTPHTAQRLADRFGCLLPTRKMVDQIYDHAAVKLAPRPIHPRHTDIMHVKNFARHHSFIETQRIGYPLGALIAGIKKDVVITPRLTEKLDRVAIYGWHRPNGMPIQRLHIGHVDWYVDYSHGIRLVGGIMRVNGKERAVAEVLADPELCGLLSDEGVVEQPRYVRHSD